MKKTLCSVLAILLVVAMMPSLLVSARWSTEIDSTIIGFSSTDMLDDREVEDFGKIVLGKDTQILRIFIKHKNFDFGTTSTSDEQAMNDQVNADLMGTLQLQFRYAGSDKEENRIPGTVDWSDIPDPKIFKEEINPVPISKSSKEAYYTITAENIGPVEMEVRLAFLDPDKKGEILEISDSIFISGRYLDPTINKKIVSIADHSLLDAQKVTGDEGAFRLNGGTVLQPNDFSNLSIQPGDYISIRINTQNFNWEPDIDEMFSAVRKATLDNDKVSVIKKVIAGNSLIKSIGFENIDGAAHVVIRFTDDFSNVKERDFDFDIALGQDGKRKNETSLRLLGTFGNPVYEVTEDRDYVFIGDGTVAHALNFCRDVELDLGEGMVVTLNLLEDQRYYGKATTAVDDDARSIMNYFPSIRKTISAKTTNIENRARFVTLKDQETNYYVYDADGQYLGRSADQLEYRDRYYLSTEEIDFTADMIDEMEAPFEEAEFIDGIDDNPSTGSGLGNGALHVVSLAVLAGGAYLLSKKSDEEQE